MSGMKLIEIINEYGIITTRKEINHQDSKNEIVRDVL